MNKKLSDVEIDNIVSISQAQDVIHLIGYLNKIIGERDLGLDGCARPLSFRSESDLNHTCFARGYLQKVREYLIETSARAGAEAHASAEARALALDIEKKVTKYIEALCVEIDGFFQSKNN
jgi:hypothetical protein